MTTFAQMQAQGEAFLKAQVGKGYTEVLGQNLGPDKWDCQGLARAVYLPFGVDIGFGSRAQFENSKVQLKPSDPWLVLDQLFFPGADPPFGHTGVYVGPVVPGGAYMMISALDTASGVCYSEINPTIGGPGFSITGRTRPLSLVSGVTVPVPAPAPPSLPSMVTVSLPIAYPGHSGFAIASIQRLLKMPGTPTGVYDTATLNALGAFLKAHNIDGGPAWRASHGVDGPIWLALIGV